MSNFITIICWGVGEYHHSGNKPDGLEFPLIELSDIASGLYQYHFAKKKTLKSKKCYSKDAYSLRPIQYFVAYLSPLTLTSKFGFFNFLSEDGNPNYHHLKINSVFSAEDLCFLHLTTEIILKVSSKVKLRP